MPRFPLRQLRVFRTLRFRLAITFLLLLTLVLAAGGLVVTATLRSVLDNQSDQVLRDQLGAVKGYLHFDESGQPFWFVHRSDPEEDDAVARLEAVFVVADDAGRVALASPDLALEAMRDRDAILTDLAEIKTTQEPVTKTIIGKDRVPYEIISSTMTDPDHHRKWYVAEGRSLAKDRYLLRRFQRNFLLFFPVALVICAIVSWWSAGNALKALQSVERAAQEITGSNLGLQIPSRFADDELDKLIGSFNQMSRRLKASFEQIRQFSTDVSHELRTPLTAIQGQLEVALFTANGPEQLREAIENALQDVERLANLVRALLLLSQSESGQIPMHKTLVNLGEIVSDLVEQFQIPAEAHNLQLTYEGAPAAWCEIDRTQIERVITNLLSNAIKYTPENGWVRVQANATGVTVRLIVEDSGVGIPNDHLPHIFDRFYRVPDPNPEKGLGLGLSFVSSIVKAHGGAINVTSDVGRGTRFDILLPVGAAAQIYEQPLLQI